MKKLTLILAFGILLNCTAAQAQQKDVKQLIAEFDKMLSEQYKANEPGATVLIEKGGKVIYKKALSIKL